MIFKNERLHRIVPSVTGNSLDNRKARSSDSIALAKEISEQKIQEKILKKKRIRISESILKKKLIKKDARSDK